MKQGIIYTTIFTFLICFVFVFFLSFVNERTEARVQFNVEIEQKIGLLNAFGIAYSDQEDALKSYEEVVLRDINGVDIYEIIIDGAPVYAKQFSGSGLWGTITGFIAVRADLSEIVGLEITSHNETPGLGGRISEPWFKDQLRGEYITEGGIHVGKSKPGDQGDADRTNGSIDAITGATRTSDSMEVILNKELTELFVLLGDQI